MVPNFDFPEGRFLRPQTASSAPVDSTTELFRAALSEPVDYPSLDNIVFPGDSVAFVLVDEIQSLDALTEALLQCLPRLLKECSVSMVSLKSNLLDESSQENWSQQLAAGGIKLNFETHDPEDQDKAAYIAVNIDGDPLYINRVLFECDVVVPIRRQSHGGQTASTIFPIYSNDENRSRFKDLPVEKQKAEVRLIRESLGINFVVDLATTPGGNIIDIAAGNCESLENSPGTDDDSSWDIEQIANGKVVVATIESNDQTWQQFFDALLNASVASLNNEQIIVRTEIDHLPGTIDQAILQLQFEMDQDAISRVLKDVPERFHGIPGILEDKSVFIMSKLDTSTVEELGLGCIENDGQIQRFINNAESGVFLRDAHLCRILDVKTI